MSTNDDNILIIPKIPKLGRPRDPNVEKRKEKTLELQERRIQLKELIQKMKEATLSDDRERTELLERACESLDKIASALHAITAVLVADGAAKAVSAVKGK